MSRYAHWIAALLFAALVLAKFSAQTGFTGLIRFGETWQDRRHSALQNLPIATAPDSNGYDGQFYAQIALDPLLRDPELKQVVDAPAYRARRILVPATAAVFGLGNPWWTLQAYALLNVLCWFALGRLLHSQIGGGGWIAFARWAGCMFSLGVLDSVRQSLVDLPALSLLVFAVWSAQKQIGARTTILFAFGHLAKESNLLASFALLFRPRFGFRRPIFIFTLSALPLLLWSFYVACRFGVSADSLGGGNFTWPFLGVLQQLAASGHEVVSGNLDSRHIFTLVAMAGFIVQAASLWHHRQAQSDWWRIGAAYSLLLLFLGSWVWSGYWAACRAVLPMTIAFNLLLPANRHFWLLWIGGNLTLLHGIWRFL